QNYTYNPQQAKQLLAAAGFPNGLDLDLNWYESGSVGDILALYQQSAAQAGLRLNLIKAPDLPSHYAKQTAKNWSGLLMAGRGLDFVDPAATTTVFLPNDPLNPGNVNDPALVDLNTKMDNASGDERK